MLEYPEVHNPTVKVRLSEREEGIDVLIEAQETLEEYLLLRVNHDGTLLLYRDVPHDFGFQMRGGFIKIVKE